MQQNARVLFCLYGTWLDHRFPKQDQWQTFGTLRSLTSWWHEGTQIYLPEVLVLVWFVCFINFVSSITTLQLEVCKSTSIISVDDESPKVSNSNSTALSALQTLHPIPAAGSRAGGGNAAMVQGGPLTNDVTSCLCLKVLCFCIQRFNYIHLLEFGSISNARLISFKCFQHFDAFCHDSFAV